MCFHSPQLCLHFLKFCITEVEGHVFILSLEEFFFFLLVNREAYIAWGWQSEPFDLIEAKMLLHHVSCIS
jgi:hypothetical protein